MCSGDAARIYKAAVRPSRGPGDERQGRRPRVSRAEAVTRVTRYIANSANRTILMSDLCRASGVSERTLRAIFMEIFGMSPMRYLRARKLHAIRAELSVAGRGIETVASVAKRLGVKDCGRMARDYRRIFGEYPRETLERRGGARRSPA